MPKSIHRLSTKQFMEVMEKGKIYTSPLFVVRVLQFKNKEEKIENKGRIAAVAPKKVASTAVMRNKLRRQIYEAVSPLIKSIIPGISIIILAKNETIKANFKDLTPDLKNLFVKAKISV